MAKNVELVNKGFFMLHPLLAGYIGRELSAVYDGNWWQEVLEALYDQTRDLPERGDYGTLVDSLDIANCLRLLDRRWNEVFRRKLSMDYRTWSRELMGVRNKAAHFTGVDFDEDYAWRALDTMSRLCEAIDEETAEEIRGLARELRYGSALGSAVSAPGPEPEPRPVTRLHQLPSWRTIIEPHPDVAEGRYKNAEFAANLNQVAHGQGPAEYRDPVEFFNRTYVTEGMKGLLIQALRRVGGLDGEPVIQLKTAFGGGKTHSMLALYHMFRGLVPMERLSGLEEVLEESGVEEIPNVHIAVLVGTALDPTKSRRPAALPGATIHTIWGEMAAQLAISAGKPELYDLVKESDRKGVSPGHDVLRELFDACGSCLILVDELVAYARKIYGTTGLPAGTYENLISFVQELTEAAGTSRTSLVVASIPESDIETGGDVGKTVLTEIEHTFGRMEAIWKPVTASEGFEVVRRRLFLNCKDPAARDAVCEAFSQMYQNNTADFPVFSREAEYRERMISCYPIHPEVFDHLYQEWSTLERFQRTRGVLRLMAAVIHELWMNQDANAMILPGSLPLDIPVVRDELTRYLTEDWNGIVDSEVDGKRSVPYQKDRSITRYASQMASRRVARTIMLGSAPTDRAQTVRGIETARIRLGTVQPGESIAVYNDALTTLQGSLSYLYASPAGDHYWYDTRPTLRKTMEDRASQVPASDVEYELTRRLKTWRKEQPFAGLHICPGTSLDVPDERSVRLVILRPQDTHTAGVEDSAARKACEELLNTRGNAPRIYRNMLLFLAPDQNAMESLMHEVRCYLAWKSIEEDKISLNLDAFQNKQTEQSLQKSDDVVTQSLDKAYHWLIAPYMDLEQNNHTIYWETDDIQGGSDPAMTRVKKRIETNESVVTRWAPSLLWMKLNELLWRENDEIAIKKLWEDFCTYCYLPRLASYAVLEECMMAGVQSSEYFAYAEGVSDGRYMGLQYDQSLPSISEYGYLVKCETAMKQILEEQRKRENSSPPEQSGGYDTAAAGTAAEASTSGTVGPKSDNQTPVSPQPERPKNTHFFLSTPLNSTRINKDMNDLVTEVINNLTDTPGAEIEITMEVHAKLPGGASAALVRTVTENCQTLKVKDFGFGEE